MRILAFLVVLFLAFPAYAQTAREKLKDDLVVDASNLTEAELDVLVDTIKKQVEDDEKARKRGIALERMEQMLEADSQLKTNLMSE